jgi:hypothetical protein
LVAEGAGNPWEVQSFSLKGVKVTGTLGLAISPVKAEVFVLAILGVFAGAWAGSMLHARIARRGAINARKRDKRERSIGWFRVEGDGI